MWQFDNVRPYYLAVSSWYLWIFLCSLLILIIRWNVCMWIQMKIRSVERRGEDWDAEQHCVVGQPAGDSLQLISCLGGGSSGQTTSCRRSWHYYPTADSQWAVKSLVRVCLSHLAVICHETGADYWVFHWNENSHKTFWNDVIRCYIQIFEAICLILFSEVYTVGMQCAHQVLRGYEYSALENLPQQGLSRSVL